MMMIIPIQIIKKYPNSSLFQVEIAKFIDDSKATGQISISWDLYSSSFKIPASNKSLFSYFRQL